MCLQKKVIFAITPVAKRHSFARVQVYVCLHQSACMGLAIMNVSIVRSHDVFCSNTILVSVDTA